MNRNRVPVSRDSQPFNSQEWQRSKFNNSYKCCFVNIEKQKCESGGEDVSFEWSHHMISFADSKVRTTLHVSIIIMMSLGVKGLISW